MMLKARYERSYAEIAARCPGLEFTQVARTARYGEVALRTQLCRMKPHAQHV